MNSFTSLQELKRAVGTAIRLDGDVRVSDANGLRERHLDDLIYSAVFSPGQDVRSASRWIIKEAARSSGLWSASIQELYEARGRGECSGFTVPAVNIRGLTYDTARALFRAAMQTDTGAFIFEIARSEIGYTEQRPDEYASVVLAAGLREGFQGPVFIQGDHFQFSASKHASDPEGETQAVLDLVEEAIRAGFLNIDIDASTLVDLSKPTVDEQQRVNYERAAQCITHIRSLEPQGVIISAGGEIGEVGKQNSTPEELAAFMDGLLRTLEKRGVRATGPSKISVQTGSSHGGVPLPDGSIAQVSIDFDTLAELSRVSRERYGMAGAVQHGASTLPEELFDRFPKVETAEIHLATGFQNLLYAHPAFPEDLHEEIRAHLRKAHADERVADETDSQFLYKTRKKAFGPFKQAMWDLDAGRRGEIGAALEDRFRFLFEKLGVPGSRQLVAQHVSRVDVPSVRPAGL